MTHKADKKPDFTAEQQVRVLRNLNQRAAAVLCGRSARWLRDSGAPRRPNGLYDSTELVAWLLSREAGEAELLDGDGGDSPGLERYRQAKAALTELDLLERQKVLIDVSKSREIHSQWSAILRRCGETLGKLYGAAAQTLLNEALVECQLAIHRFRDYADGGPADE